MHVETGDHWRRRRKASILVGMLLMSFKLVIFGPVIIAAGIANEDAIAIVHWLFALIIFAASGGMGGWLFHTLGAWRGTHASRYYWSWVAASEFAFFFLCLAIALLYLLGLYFGFQADLDIKPFSGVELLLIVIFGAALVGLLYGRMLKSEICSA